VREREIRKGKTLREGKLIKKENREIERENTHVDGYIDIRKERYIYKE
jgi:hypothetical protein